MKFHHTVVDDCLEWLSVKEDKSSIETLKTFRMAIPDTPALSQPPVTNRTQHQPPLCPTTVQTENDGGGAGAIFVSDISSDATLGSRDPE